MSTFTGCALYHTKQTNPGVKAIIERKKTKKVRRAQRNPSDRFSSDGKGLPLSIFGLSWLGIRTERLDELSAFFERVLGMHLVHRCAGDHVIYRADNGDYVALYGPKQTKRFELFSTGPVVGFRVGNIVEARRAMEGAGVKFIGAIAAKDNGRWKYSHFRAPDGRIYELVEESPWASSKPHGDDQRTTK